MKAIFRFCKPGPTFNNFASMTVVNFDGLSKLKNANIELKVWI